MLVNVNVENLALIDKEEVFFSEGLNIMTGETGAGKSIIIGSILIALGGKVPKDIVRDSSKSGFVELIFQIQNASTEEKLKEFGIFLDDEKTLIISRKIVNGRSVIKVNNETYTVTNLRKITELLIDIHGQHDHQSLLKESKQLEILDDFAGETVCDLKQKISLEYREYQAIKAELETYDLDDESRQREISFCQYEIDEIENAGLKVGEYEKLEHDYKKMSASKEIDELMRAIYYLIEEDEGAVSDRLSKAYGMSITASEHDEDLKDISESLGTLENICDDVKRSVRTYMDSTSYDEEECRQIEERLDLLNTLRQKYERERTDSDPVVNILNYLQKQQQTLDTLIHLEEKKEEILKQKAAAEKKLTTLSEKLSKERKKAAAVLAQNIENVLKGLNFLEAKFDIMFEEKRDFSSNGTDSVTFMITTNPGESLKPLDKVASGGELSRIMLGIKTIMASKDEIDTLIFDEIDTGISGKTAQMVAIRLKELSKVHQVICITHLPQIASMADTHFLIEKSANENVTTTSIKPLNEEETIDELSRMLGGVTITDAVRQNAIELKKNNQMLLQ